MWCIICIIALLITCIISLHYITFIFLLFVLGALLIKPGDMETHAVVSYESFQVKLTGV